MALRFQIHHLAAGHTVRARRLRKLQHQLRADLGVAAGSLVREDFEGEGVQAVAREDGGRFAIGLVYCWLPPPEVVIIHRRKVVVDERVDVDRFNCRADPKGLLFVDFE